VTVAAAVLVLDDHIDQHRLTLAPQGPVDGEFSRECPRRA
jgi:hypothetical protein